ncbi:hypothetical protein CHLNCDRAFT_145259 [Chlorella variabilis]|uniref:ATP-dependent DNA helicase n=1 Tax=Chlorella variabilis TaxID=554065 RepID=E1ZE17_CHLVA|nr:hypothetical protein CHLNCDRAFT_145259 [Chlorella variabilis]EFN55791.1 hypothetical protein CHLNCDRAFT_145259 [Chlorella variabilis]|eukprot:XP_005847893.1 hypothetical protein CHLNCDRAFT_145259 [Chlorella variabilis]
MEALASLNAAPTHISDTVEVTGSRGSTGPHVSETLVGGSLSQDVAGGSQAVDSIALSDEQQRVVALVKAGKNVFYTGDAGTGKSFLLNQIVAELQTKHGDEFGRLVAVTAATGIAATHINGSTVHSALGCGAPRVTDDFSRMWKKENRGRLRALKANN